MYIIIGSNAQSEYASFQHALLFAQEYGILAAGMEDRPFIPITTVVLEGVPKDMRSVFRKWVPELSPTTHNPPASSLQRGRSLRVLPLNAALGAIRNWVIYEVKWWMRKRVDDTVGLYFMCLWDSLYIVGQTSGMLCKDGVGWEN